MENTYVHFVLFEAELFTSLFTFMDLLYVYNGIMKQPVRFILDKSYHDFLYIATQLHESTNS